MKIKKSVVHLVTIFFLVLTFASWGVADYVRDVRTGEVIATVGEQPIPLGLFESQLERFRNYARQERPDVSDTALNNPRLVRQQLNQLIQEQLITQYVRDAQLMPSVDRLTKEIVSQSEFSENGTFSKERYLSLIRQTRQTVEEFESQAKVNLARESFMPMLAKAEILTDAEFNSFQRIIGETRHVLPHRVVSEKFVDQVKLTEQDIQAYFEKNQADFDQPARVNVKYLEFSPQALSNTLKEPDDNLLKDFYETLKAEGEFTQKEFRDARHILFSFDGQKSEGAQDTQALREKADNILKKIHENPEDFAKLAQEHSDDPGSRDAGGLIQNIQHGQMVESFDEAVFSQPVGSISGLVESPYGFHIIRVEKVTPARLRPFEAVKSEIAPRFNLQKAEKLYSALSEEFITLVNEQKINPEGLEAIAEHYELSVAPAVWVDRDTQVIPFNTKDVLQAALLPQNAEAQTLIDVPIKKEKRIVVLKIIEREPSRPRALNKVYDDVQQAVKKQRITALIDKEVKAKMQKLQSGTDELLWERPIKLNRFTTRENPRLLDLAFSLPPSPLPTYTSVEDSPTQHTIYKLIKIEEDPEIIKQLGAQANTMYQRYWNDLQNQVILSALLQKYPVTINETLFERTIKQQ